MSDQIKDKAPKGMENYFFRASASDFKKIPGSPIAYWASKKVFDVFLSNKTLSDIAPPKIGMRTGNNDRFLRLWHEAAILNIGFDYQNSESAMASKKRWFPYNKGGAFRKWFGNNEYLVNWFNDGYEIKENTLENYPQLSWDSLGWKISNERFFFHNAITWTATSSSYFGVRQSNAGFIFDVKGSFCIPDKLSISTVLGFLASKQVGLFLKFLNPTIEFQPRDIGNLPISENIVSSIQKKRIEDCVTQLLNISKSDWNSYETSWDFTHLPLIQVASGQELGIIEEAQTEKPTPIKWPLNARLSDTYTKLRQHWQSMTLEMQKLEEENNRIFIDAYGLQEELTPEVPLEEITLTCNPQYRYGVKECEVGSQQWEEMEARLLQGTMKELISYAVGCMFGRYSLNMPGLVLANQGETLADFVRKVSEYLVESNEKGGRDGHQQLSGSDSVAESHGSCRNDLSGNPTIPERRVVRSNESDSQGGSIDSLQHSRGAGAQINTGLQKISADCSGFESRSGDSAYISATIELSKSGAIDSNFEPSRRNIQNDQQPAGKAQVDNPPLPTSDSLLTTPHSLLPTETNVIPILDKDWFSDDITERFCKFLRATFGEKHYAENLMFVEQSLNIKGKRNYGIRDYFLSEFYDDHVRRYKKRPIYWLFSSPKGSFNALIYMHRYRPDTVSVVLNTYLREFIDKIDKQINQLEIVSGNPLTSPFDKNKALKELERLKKILSELQIYEKDVLFPLATQKLEIDLDDGVKVNYTRFGGALKKIAGLDAKENE